MKFLFIFFISIIPGLLWVWFFYRQDRYDKEPIRLILIVFSAGMLSVIPAVIWESPFRELLLNPPNLFVRFVAAFLVVGLGEELFKLLAVYLFVYHRHEFDEPADGIIYAVTASLGFASLENAFYTVAFGLSVAPVRALITSLAHASFGGIAGLYLGLAKCRPGYGFRHVVQGLLIAAFLHGLYDFLIMANLVHPLFAILIILSTYRFLSTKLRSLVNAP